MAVCLVMMAGNVSESCLVCLVFAIGAFNSSGWCCLLNRRLRRRKMLGLLVDPEVNVEAESVDVADVSEIRLR